MTCYKDGAARPDGLARVFRAHMEMARKTSNFRRNLDIMTAGGLASIVERSDGTTNEVYVNYDLYNFLFYWAVLNLS